MGEKFRVGNFEFESEIDAERARSEAEKVAYIRERTDLSNLKVVKRLYDKLVEDQVFETPVGAEFIIELRTKLGIDKRNTQIKSQVKIPDPDKVAASRKKAKAKEAKVKAIKAAEGIKSALIVSIMINVLLVIIIIAMLVISRTSDNITILNYENKIVDKYENWEKELQEREDKVRELEKTDKMLGITQNEHNSLLK